MIEDGSTTVEQHQIRVSRRSCWSPRWAQMACAVFMLVVAVVACDSQELEPAQRSSDSASTLETSGPTALDRSGNSGSLHVEADSSAEHGGSHEPVGHGPAAGTATDSPVHATAAAGAGAEPARLLAGDTVTDALAAAASGPSFTATVAARATATVQALESLTPPQTFAVAEELAHHGSTDSAIDAYRLYAEAEPSMSDIAAMGIGNVQFDAGRYAEALTAFTRAYDEAADPTTRFLAALRQGNAMLRLGPPSDALTAYDHAYATAQDDTGRAQAWAGKIAVLVESGRLDEAFELRSRLVRELPDTALAQGALARLDEAGMDVPLAERAAVAAGNGDHATAMELYGEAIASRVDPPGAWTVALARSLAASGDHGAVVSLADDFLAGRGEDGAALDLAWLRARSLSRRGLDSEAAEAYLDISRMWPYDDDAPDALHRRALILEFLDGAEAGAVALDELRGTYPGYDGYFDALLRSALLYYQVGSLPLAAERWLAAADHGNAEQQSQAWFWLGRAAAESGDRELATEYWRSAVDADPDGYYGLRAAEPLGERLDPPPPGSGNVRTDSGSWLSSWQATGPSEWDRKLATVGDSRNVQRARALLDLDRRSSAGRALRRELDGTTDPATLAALAIAASELGVHEVSIAAASRLLGASGAAGTASAPLAVWRLAYPDAFGDHVRAEATRLGVPEGLMFALMRQESRFDPTAQSPVGARGLAQVMPGTGEGIASALGESGFDVSDLLVPETSVRYGTWYLSQQLERYDGRYWAALSAYNGGPGNAQRWLDAAGGDRDLFTEMIDFRETRRYVKLVEEQRAQYSRLYRDPEPQD